MGHTASQIYPAESRHVEIVVHVDEMLAEADRKRLVDVLIASDGIEIAEFCPLRWHLMLVQYDRDRINSQDVLKRVHDNNVHAELIGPV